MTQPRKRPACCNLEDSECCGESARIPVTKWNRIAEIEEPSSSPGVEEDSLPFDTRTENANVSRISEASAAQETSQRYRRPASREDFQIAIICALPIEYNAVCLLIDQWWDEGGKTYGRAPGDLNTYRNGRLGEHNVVLLLLPKMGKSSAAGSTASMRSSYYNVSLALLVGICGGVPSAGKREVLLGDVVIGEHIFQYDFGRQYRRQHVPKAEEEGNLGSLNKELSGLLAYFKTEPGRKEAQRNAAKYLTVLQKASVDTESETDYRYPGIPQDKLFQAIYPHKHQEEEEGNCQLCAGDTEDYCQEADRTSCEDLGCDEDMLMVRLRLKKKQKLATEEERQRPEIFIGNIASGDTVMRSSEHRDQIARQGDIIAFEMEGAGAFDETPSLVIKGVSDYADSHKNKIWQPFAAATAASVAKAVLERYTPPEAHTTATLNKYGFDEQDQKCLADLRVTNPVDDKARITQTKGNLLKDSYAWILEHDDFKAWKRDETQVLWITGDPGKGKTMLLCGLIEEIGPSTMLEDKTAETLLSYFLFQGTDSRIHNATAALRSLISMLFEQHPALITVVREKYDAFGKQLFQDTNAWFALSAIFTNILKDLGNKRVYIFLDALDECTIDASKLLDIIVQSSTFLHVKWILSSRNIADIQRRLKSHNSCARLRLESEANAEYVSKAVDNYIEHSISELSLVFSDQVDILTVRDTMRQKANGTFLWVSLITRELKEANFWDVDQILEEFPTELSTVYDRMVEQIKQQRPETRRLCSLILSTLVVVYRPLHLEEVAVLPHLPKNVSGKPEIVQNLIHQCASFFSIRDNYVYIIHQSAMDFLSETGVDLLIPNEAGWRAERHNMIFSQSLKALSTTLKRDIYNLEQPDFLVENIQVPHPDPLISVRYSCVHWIHHFSQTERCGAGRTGGEESIRIFLKKHFLHWLEALGLVGKIFEGIRGVILLLSMVEAAAAPDLHGFLSDARRFILSFASIIQEAPLQTYYSALSFAPQQSLVRQQFENDRCRSIDINPVQEEWGPLLQTIKAPGNYVDSLTLSPDGQTIISCSDSAEVVFWDRFTGMMLKRAVDRWSPTSETIISSDGKKIMSNGTLTSRGGFKLIWDHETDATVSKPSNLGYRKIDQGAYSTDGETVLLARKKGSSYKILIKSSSSNESWDKLKLEANALAFSPDCRLIAYLFRGELKLWDIKAGKVLRAFETGITNEEPDHPGRNPTTSILFSPNGEFIASKSNNTMRLFDAETGECVTVVRYSSAIEAISISPNSRMLACALGDATVKLWDIPEGHECQSLTGCEEIVGSMAFSPDSEMIATASALTSPVSIPIKAKVSIRIWNTTTGELLRVLEAHDCRSNSIAFPPDGQTLILASGDGIVRRWNIATGEAIPATECRSIDRRLWHGTDISISPTGESIALTSSSSGVDLAFIRLWDKDMSTVMHTLEGCGKPIDPVVFSPNGRIIAAAFNNLNFAPADGRGSAEIKIWDVETGALLRTCNIPDRFLNTMTFSPDGRVIALASNDGIIFMDVETGSVDRTYDPEWSGAHRISYSPCGRKILVLFAELYGRDRKNVAVKYWDLATMTFSPEPGSRGKMFSPFPHMGRLGSGIVARPKANSLATAISPGSEIVITGTTQYCYEISIYNTVSGEAREIPVNHLSHITSIAFSPDGETVVLGSNNSTILVWELEKPKTNTDPVANNEGLDMYMAIHEFIISEDTGTAVSLSVESMGDDYMYSIGILWDTVTGKYLCTPLANEPVRDNTNRCIAVSPDGKRLAYGYGCVYPSSESVPRVKLLTFDAEANPLEEIPLDLNPHQHSNVTLLVRHPMTFSLDGKELRVMLKNFGREEPLRERTFDTPTPRGYTIMSYDASSGRYLGQLDFESDGFAASLSQGGELFASVTHAKTDDPLSPQPSSQTIKIQTLKDLRHLSTLEGFEGSINETRFSQDSKFLLVRHSARNDSFLSVCDILENTVLSRHTEDFKKNKFPLEVYATEPPESAPYLRTRTGVSDILTSPEEIRAVFPRGEEYPAVLSKCLFVEDDWIAHGGKRVIRLPEKYTGITAHAFRDNLLVIASAGGGVLFLRSR
ncbi:hypothetical protein TWF481_003807 [Arthrobotrys musiformis]|uniref:NACHT domain-containing protein n=1 Tax=Arthrobotrys musiformis TaxID=47236 RepID=A0AAV9WJQ5_9PEZI